jgi:hypothetical protein
MQVGTIPTIPVPPGDPNVIPPRPEDVPILEAYAAYVEAFYLAASGDPSGDAALAATTTAGLYEEVSNFVSSQHALGLVMSTTQGLALRPRVLVDPRTDGQALLLDCQVDGTYWIDAATGSPSPGESTSIVSLGGAIRLVNEGAGWLVDAAGEDGRGCLG